MRAKLVVEGKEFPIDIYDPELVKLVLPSKKTDYEHVIKGEDVDTVELTYCRDCVNYTKSPFGHLSIGWCKMDGKHRRQNFYCADGVKKA